MPPKRITILGVGLLGGSIGLALRSIINDCKIIGYGHRESSLQMAIQIGAIDQALPLPEAIQAGELIIACTPVGVFEQLMPQIAQFARPGTIITDVGSTKRTIVRAAEAALPFGVHFVGSHPMAGSEKRGVEFARADLFQHALCITTPTPKTDPQALELVEAFWKSFGMRLARLAPDEHDRLLADISHLPHALAAALVAMQADAGMALAGKGFLDTTRIAGGDGALWRDILLDNRDNLQASIARLKDRLSELENMLKSGSGDELARWLDRSAQRREELRRRKLRDLEE